MSPIIILCIILGYFGVLIAISKLVSKSDDDNAAFFSANKNAPWYLVAFGMIGASLSGVTFISIPGKVATDQFSYFQIVIGYILGYFIIATLLLPLYYKYNLITIYTYLENRFGKITRKTASAFFIISRVVGSNLRLMLVADVLQILVFDALHIPYFVTVTATLWLIWVYTQQSGLKTIVWTDTLQTLFMLISLGYCLTLLSQDLGVNISNISTYISNSDLSKTFFFEDWRDAKYFWKHFFSGAVIALAMTGLDQDMMQKNLSCKSLKDAQKNMLWFTITLVFVNFVFLIVGLLLSDYAVKHHVLASGDKLFPIIANEYLGLGVAAFFLIGLIAAAFSSADSALTSLTTAVSIDILEIQKKYNIEKQVEVRKQIHRLFVWISIAVILFFKYLIADSSVIDKVLKYAGFTYGPLLGLFALGLFSKIQINDKATPYVAIVAVVLSIVLNLNSLAWFGFSIGFEIIIINALIMLFGLRIAALSIKKT